MERKKPFQNMLGVQLPRKFEWVLKSTHLEGCWKQRFLFLGYILFAKFRLGKHDFDPYKGGFFMGKMAQIRQISDFKNSKLPVSYDNFQKVAKNIKGFCFVKKKTFISIM
jgi:hypothetical protein